jgi:hypothetical protein
MSKSLAGLAGFESALGNSLAGMTAFESAFGKSMAGFSPRSATAWPA